MLGTARSPPTPQSASAAISAIAGNSGSICKANTTSPLSNAIEAWKSRAASGRPMQREYGSSSQARRQKRTPEIVL
jgi:hypothetical protein